MKTTKSAILCCALAASVVMAPTASWGADEQGRFAVKGVGNTSCKTYVNELANHTSNSYLYAGWLNGYLTAQNQQLKNTFDLISWETVDTLGNYLVNYCRKNPDQSFYMAVSAMLGGLYNHRIEAFTPAVNVTAGGQGVRVYLETLKQAQQALAKLGLYKGEINGEYNKAMLEAIKKFQKSKGLEVTGLPDQQTLFRLLPKGSGKK